MTNSDRDLDSSVMMSSAMPSAKNSCSASLLMLVNARTAIEGLSGSASGGDRSGGNGVAAAAGRGRQHAIGPHRARDVLEALLAHVLEDEVEPCGHILVDTSRDADAAGVGQRFQPRGDVHAVAEDVAVVADDDLADVDADAILDPFRRGRPSLKAAIRRCISLAQRTASMTLANSISSPSPVVLTSRP